MLSSSLFTMLKLSKTTSPNKLFDYDCITLYSVPYSLVLELKGKTQIVSNLNNVSGLMTLKCKSLY